MMTLIDRLNTEGTTIVMVSHDLDLVARHARRVVVMNDGAIIADGPTVDVLRQTSILRAAGVDTTETAVSYTHLDVYKRQLTSLQSDVSGEDT